MLPATDVRIALTTTASQQEAERIARALVEERLAACVNILPGLTSIYRWHGTVETANEILLVIKTTAANLDALEAAIQRLHSYEIPELLVLTPESASEPYLGWLLDQTTSPGAE